MISFHFLFLINPRELTKLLIHLKEIQRDFKCTCILVLEIFDPLPPSL